MQVPPSVSVSSLPIWGRSLITLCCGVLRSGQYIGGNEIQTFETAFAASVGTPHAVGCNSGTDALILALTRPGHRTWR